MLHVRHKRVTNIVQHYGQFVCAAYEDFLCAHMYISMYVQVSSLSGRVGYDSLALYTQRHVVESPFGVVCCFI